MHFPHLHSRPAQGWLNDPNGVMYYGDRYHLMFQYNPKSVQHERIHWGHFSSADLVRWREEPLAIVPGDDFEDSFGAWSGVGAIIDGEPIVAYSGVLDDTGESSVHIAEKRGRGFYTREIAAPMPTEPLTLRDGTHPRITAIRDPFLFLHEGTRYALQGCGFDDDRAGVLLYDATDIDAWVLLGALLTSDEVPAKLADTVAANLWECPQLINLDGQWILIVSLWQRQPDGTGLLNGVAYLAGALKAAPDSTLQFEPTFASGLDNGPDFYAPQCATFGPGALAGDPGIERTLLWGWAREGATRTAAETQSQGWAGVLTFPREVHANTGGREGMRCVPSRELMQLRKGLLDNAKVVKFRGSAEVVVPPGAVVTFNCGGREVPFTAGDDGLRAFIDGSILEVFSDSIRAAGCHTQRLYTGRYDLWRVTSTDPVEVYRLSL